MNDEIKEILDNFKNYEERYKLHNETQFIITHREIQVLLDYITNLQQSLKDMTDINLGNEKELTNLQQENEIRQQDINNLTYQLAKMKEENERLKETAVYCNRTDCVGRIKDSRKYDSVYQEKEDYKSRCEKASEYIKENQEEEYVTGKPMLSYWAIDNLLNILQNGSDSQ